MRDQMMQDGRFMIGMLWGTLLSLPIWAGVVALIYWIFFSV
ncbi:hypothetical protein [Bacillus sp. JCM 19041]